MSGFIGARKRMAVLPITWRTAKLSVFTTAIFALPFVLFPEFCLYPIFGGRPEMVIIDDAKPILIVLYFILIAFSFGGVFFNALVGTGATWFGLKIQFITVSIYIAYVYIIIEFFNGNLSWAWSAEIPYWLLMFGIGYWYLKTNKWHWLRIWEE